MLLILCIFKKKFNTSEFLNFVELKGKFFSTALKTKQLKKIVHKINHQKFIKLLKALMLKINKKILNEKETSSMNHDL